MPDKTPEQKINELYTHLIGVNGDPGTLELLREDMKDIGERLDNHSNRIRRVEVGLVGTGALVMLISVLIGIGVIPVVPL